MTALTQVELDGVAEVMAAAGTASIGPLVAEPIHGGRSNQSFRVSDGESTWVLRLPPRGGRTVSAHDVAREYRVTSALHGQGVPIARPVLLWEDESLFGVPFAMAEFVAGRTIQLSSQLADLSDAMLDGIVHSLVANLAALHGIDHVRIGLESFGRPDAYASRQLSTWSRQWEVARTLEFDELQVRVRDLLRCQIPEQRRVSVVHGDYRIDNTILGFGSNSSSVLAIVDWELSTIGDPVADVATMAAYRHSAFDLIVGAESAWTSPRLPDANGLAEAYTRTGAGAIDNWQFHLALAHYKIAVIAAGIAHRHRHGSGQGPGFETAGHAISPYLEAAMELLAESA